MMTPPPRAGGLADSLGALHRLQRLRALLGSEGLDALCLIGGVDGRPAAGSGRIAQGGLSSSALAGEALGWLLGALSGRSLAGGATAEVFEEVVLVLTPTHVRLYLPRNAWIALGPRLAMWDNLQLWLPPTGAQDDFELLEEHKARSFVQMLCGVGSLGVCLDTGDARAGAASTVESWPLVQVRHRPPCSACPLADEPAPFTRRRRRSLSRNSKRTVAAPSSPLASPSVALPRPSGRCSHSLTHRRSSGSSLRRQAGSARDGSRRRRASRVRSAARPLLTSRTAFLRLSSPSQCSPCLLYTSPSPRD